MKIHEWLGDLCGCTLQSSAFYRDFFKLLFENDKVYFTEVQGWSYRSRQRWIARISSGNLTEQGLNIVRRVKAGSRGKVYYVWSALFVAKLQSLYLRVKKGLR